MVKLDGGLSEGLLIKAGVPQGSILGPLLFIMFINDLPNSIKESRCLVYADDTTLYATGTNSHNIEFALNEDLKNVSQWFRQNRLKLNVAKTKFMVVQPRNMSSRYDTLNVYVNGLY